MVDERSSGIKIEPVATLISVKSDRYMQKEINTHYDTLLTYVARLESFMCKKLIFVCCKFPKNTICVL